MSVDALNLCRYALTELKICYESTYQLILEQKKKKAWYTARMRLEGILQSSTPSKPTGAPHLAAGLGEYAVRL